VTFGISSAGRLLVVSHSERGEAIRIISARATTPSERRIYEEGKSSSDELRAEYRRSDFKKLDRGKYYERAKENSNVVVLDPEVAAVFPNSDAVNEALRSLIEVGSRVSRLASASNRPTRLRRSHG